VFLILLEVAINVDIKT